MPCFFELGSIVFSYRHMTDGKEDFRERVKRSSNPGKVCWL